mmetsp:Transcript_77768/g.240962  ORF Transcript_77768/g.240962 Transcript_77768/m.240962 type:complete len:226 (-) Transcript_77768:728-1405(-)
MRSSLLSISSIMPVIFPASSGWIFAMAGKSFSPIICFWTEGGAAASVAAFKGAPGPAIACAPGCGCCCCWGMGGPPGMPGRAPMGICGIGGRIIPICPGIGPPMGPMPGMPIMPGLPPIMPMPPGQPLPIMPIICGFIMGPRGPIIVARGPIIAWGGIMPIICGGIMPIICGPPLPIMPIAMGMGPWKPCPPPYICGIMPFPSLPPPPLPPLGPPGPGIPPAPGE